MKSLRVFLCLLAVGALMTACQKENLQQSENLSDAELLEKEIKADYAKYVAEHEELTIEYTTLEELNAVFGEHGMEPVTLEGLGITEEEYRIAQEKVNNPEIAQERCSGYLALYYGDMNNNGSLNVFDILQINSWLLIYGNGNSTVTPPGSEYRRAALFSAEVGVWPGTTNQGNEHLYLNQTDKNIAVNIILGIPDYDCI